ncbi:hypothetical protein K505DRAFT_252587 [Melanomma pulvis-pyrius CBS 109.77]|uniref:Uncharacterized protein n=1 Tax=Melanomma pulvis-pyrius CBS 109.77 TaxID=1314802 RepID=A0A6A6X1I6_9PLEO|nr:hypothetical protein K505DRAFT_252587 [Melanomma pulvis-pyrius CBS 109.77]
MKYDRVSEDSTDKEDVVPLIGSDDEENDFANARAKLVPKASLASRLLGGFLRLVLVTLAVLAILRLSFDIWEYWANPSAPRSCSCGGTSVNEALRRNCRFDPISSAWLPPHCRDDELIDDFNRNGDGPNGGWAYYSDWNKTAILSEEEVGRLADVGGQFYTTFAWHIKHCSYNWRKLWRMKYKNTGVTMTARAGAYGHLEHCEKMFLEQRPIHEVLTFAGVSLDADLGFFKPKGSKPDN